jgi:FAD/FMN-containing dehydrogenase
MTEKLNESVVVTVTMKDHIRTLKKLLSDSIITDKVGDLVGYRDIGFPSSNISLIIRPGTYDDISSLLKYCNEHDLPIVPWGGGTNLCGALSPDQPSIALDMKSLNSIIAIDAENSSMTVQAGATFEALHLSLEPKGLRFIHDPWSWRSATVGGALSLDSSGNLYPKYGSIRDQVLAMKVALADGRIIDVGTHLTKSSALPFLPALFIGSEGKFGIILEATFTLSTPPQDMATLGFAFSNFHDLFMGLRAIIDAGIEPQAYIGGTIPTRVEKLQPKSERIVVKLLGIHSALFLYYEGTAGEVASRISTAKQLLGGHGRKMPDTYAAEWWPLRHTYFEMSPELASEGIYVHVFDLSVPVSEVDALSAKVDGIAEHLGITHGLSHTLFAAPDAYTVALYVDDTGEGRSIVADCDKLLVPIVHDAGGSMTRTHGLGTLFDEDVAIREIGDGNLHLLRELKALLDPKGILNPGIMFRGK